MVLIAICTVGLKTVLFFLTNSLVYSIINKVTEIVLLLHDNKTSHNINASIE